jgi:hypothetical protein
MLSALRDGADGGFKIEVRRMNLDLFPYGYGFETGRWMGGVCDAKLSAVNERRHSGMIDTGQGCGVRDGSQQVADEIVQLDVGDEVRCLLVEQRSPEHARKSQQGVTAARQTVGLAVGADQLTLDTEGGGLQRDKINVLKSRAIYSLAKHDCWILASFTVLSKVNRSRRVRK